MHISLTPELKSHVKAKVETVFFNNTSEVIREVFRFMETHEDWVHEIKLTQLREQLKADVDQLDRGDGIKVESRSALDTLFEDIKS